MTNTQKKRIAILGGAGYIGAHTCKALAHEGYKILVVDNLSQGHEEFVKWGYLAQQDLLDRHGLREVLATFSPTAIMHFAAHCTVGESVENPGKYYENNVAGTLNVLSIMRELSIPRLVFSSTCATYGLPLEIPMGESHPQNPINPYGQTKLMVERMLSDFDRAYGIRSVSLRYFNAAGADPEGEIGELHEPETHLIPIVLDVAGGKRPAVTVFGNDYTTPDGTCIRDYIHVVDIAQAHVKALDFLIRENRSEAFNLGNGRGYSVQEVLAAARRVTARKIPGEIGPRRLGDPDRLVGSSEKARKVLNWVPAYPQIDTIIQHAWNFHQRFHL
jgi:UDP-glucose-4-epimerase GalE